MRTPSSGSRSAGGKNSAVRESVTIAVASCSAPALASLKLSNAASTTKARMTANAVPRKAKIPAPRSISMKKWSPLDLRRTRCIRPTAAEAATATIRATIQRFTRASCRSGLACRAGHGRRAAQGADDPVVHGSDRLSHQLDRGLDALLSDPLRRLPGAGAGAAGADPAAADPADPRGDARRDRL